MKDLVVAMSSSLLIDKGDIHSAALLSPKYFLYSSHDTQVSIMWEHLSKILDFEDWYYIPYAS